MLAKDLLQLGQEFETPLYVYDAEKIKSQFDRLSNAFSKVQTVHEHDPQHRLRSAFRNPVAAVSLQDTRACLCGWSCQ